MSDPYQQYPAQNSPQNPGQYPQNPGQYQAQPPVPYGQPYPPVAPALPEHPKAQTILILGIVGFFVPIVSFVAWFMGNGVVKEMRASGVSYSNEQYAVIGRILGIVMSIIQIASVLVGIFMVVGWLIFFFGVVATSGG